MRIGFDAKRLFHNRTGLGVYSRLLVQQLHSAAPQHEYVLYDRQAKKSPFFSSFQNHPIRTGRGPLWRSWRLSHLVRQDKCDIYHGLSHELPRGPAMKGVAKVVTIHDLIFERFPTLYPKIDRMIYRSKWRHACRTADAIISISESTKKDLIAFYDVDPKKIITIPPMHDRRFEARPDPALQEDIRRRYALPHDYILYVGAVVQRKGLEQIIRAMNLLEDADRPPLVIVGAGKKYLANCKAVARTLGVENDLHWCDFVPNEDLPSIYLMANALVYPSVFEGFGIPIIEALYAGTPVITSNVSSLPEAAGKGALLVDPESPEEIAEAIQQLQTDSQLADTLVNRAQQHLEAHKNPVLAQRILDLYQGLAQMHS